MTDEETTDITASAIIEHQDRLTVLRADEAEISSQLASARDSLKILGAQRGEIASAALGPDEVRVANLERHLRDNRSAIADEERRGPSLDARHDAAMRRAELMPEYWRREAAKARAAVAGGLASSETLDQRVGLRSASADSRSAG